MAPTPIIGWLHQRGTAALPGYFIADTPWAGWKAESAGGVNRYQASSALAGGVGYEFGGAINNYTDRDYYLSSGTYKMGAVHAASSNEGITDVQFNGVSQGTWDAYSALLTWNVYTELTGLSVTAGVKTVRLTSSTKNASASDYFVLVQGFALVRTGA